MFYLEDKFLPYPTRSILYDVLLRGAGEYESSTTSKCGCRELIKEQLGMYNRTYTLEEILRSAKDFNADIMHPTCDWQESVLTAEERFDYIRRLEDIDDRWIREYAKNILIGFKKNRKNGMLEINKLDAADTNGFLDDETGEVVAKADLEEVYQPFRAEEIIESKIRLAYVLKQLQIGSEEMRVHLLSFIIAEAKLSQSINENKSLRPKDFANAGVYKVDRYGYVRPDLICSIIDNNNSSNPFTGFVAGMSWITGTFKSCRSSRKYPDTWIKYHNAYLELLKIVNVLEINLAEENPLVYNKDLIDNAVCLYLPSNDEYILSNEYIYSDSIIDKSIVELLKVESLDDIIKQINEEVAVPERYRTDSECVEAIASIVQSRLSTDELELYDIRKNIVELIDIVTKGDKITAQLYFEEKGIIYKNNGEPLRVRMSGVTNDNVGNSIGVVTLLGQVIIIEDFSEQGFYRYVNLESVLLAVKNKDIKGDLEYAKI